MRIEFIKYNPNHDERGRFASSPFEEADVKHLGGKTLKDTAKRMVANQNHPLLKKDARVIISSMMQHHDVNFVTARDAFMNAHTKADKVLHARSGELRYPIRSLNSTHPLQIKPDEPRALIKPSEIDPKGKIAAEAKKLEKLDYTIRNNRTKYWTYGLHYQGSLKQIAALAAKHAKGRRESPDEAVKAATPKLQKLYNSMFSKGKKEFERLNPRPDNKQKWEVDHILPGSWTFHTSEKSVREMNKVENYRWMLASANKGRQDQVYNKRTGELYVSKIPTKYTKDFTVDALEAIRAAEKVFKKQIVVGGVKQSMIDSARKAGRSKADFRKLVNSWRKKWLLSPLLVKNS
jgi:hypothetical protein